ncbi:MAG: glycosyltransferase family 4 protein [Planctomycetes bacterium]|nr:glycosyltransferase family 4 protein [Planctomycetota bacterium]
MRILHIIRPGTGGAPRHLEILVRLLSRRGFEFAVAASPLEDPAFLDRLAAAGACEVHSIPIERPPAASDAAAFGRLLALAASRRWDGVHCHTTKPGLLGRVAARLAGVRRVFYTPHGFYFNYPIPRVQRRFYLALERTLAPLTTRILLIGPQEGRQVASLRLAPASRFAVVPNCVDPDEGQDGRTREEILAAIGLDGLRPVVLWVGRLDPPKDPASVVRACARLSRAGLEIDLVLVGDGSQAGECHRLAASEGIEERVHLPGFREDARALMAAADLLVLASAWEGLPYVLLEAQAAGRPVVATDLPGCRDACLPGETGLLFPHGDDLALAGAIESLLADPTRAREMGERGSAFVRERFGPEAWADRMEAIYRG